MTMTCTIARPVTMLSFATEVDHVCVATVFAMTDELARGEVVHGLVSLAGI